MVYVKGKFLKIVHKDFNLILEKLKESLLDKLGNEIDYKNIEDIKYLKWCYDKLILENKDINVFSLKPRCVCWVDFGQNIGSELRKLRPAILWRSSLDKKMWSELCRDRPIKRKYLFSYNLSGIKDLDKLAVILEKKYFLYNSQTP